MKRMATIAAAIVVAGGSIGAVAVAANGRDEAPPAGTLTVDAQFPTPESGQLSANLADPKGSPETDPAKIADLFAGNGKLFQGGKQVGTLHFDNVVTQADPARAIITVALAPAAWVDPHRGADRSGLRRSVGRRGDRGYGRLRRCARHSTRRAPRRHRPQPGGAEVRPLNHRTMRRGTRRPARRVPRVPRARPRRPG